MKKTDLQTNKDWLIWARESVYYDKDTVANKMGISIETLNDWEDTGKIDYSSLVKLSEIYKQSPLLFFNKNKPYYDKDMPDYRTINNKKVNITPKIAFELRDALIKRENMLNIEAEDNSLEIPVFNFNNEEPLKIIKSLLNITKAKLITYSLENWIATFEKLGILVFQFYGISPNELRGYAIYKDKLPIIGINHQESDNGKKFTLFHELVHLVLKKDGLSNFESYYMDNLLEVKCNAIAAEVLVPSDVLKNYIESKRISNFTDLENIKTLSKMFKVSEEVIIRRFLTLGYITNHDYNKHKVDLNSFIFYKKSNKRNSQLQNNSNIQKKTLDKKEKYNREAVKTIKKNGKLYINYLFAAYDKEIIDDLDLIDNLNQSVDVIKSIYKKLNGM